MIYIATFYSHFGAVRYQLLCAQSGIVSRTMPVPRQLSSSCGTCVRCEDQWLPPEGEWADEVEQIVSWDGRSYTAVYRSEE